MRRRCSNPDCRVVLDDTQAGVYREITGWERVRAGGGAHAITQRKETGKVLCGPCMTDRKSGKVAGQGALI